MVSDWDGWFGGGGGSKSARTPGPLALTLSAAHTHKVGVPPPGSGVFACDLEKVRAILGWCLLLLLRIHSAQFGTRPRYSSFLKDGTYQYKGIFVWFMTTVCGKSNLSKGYHNPKTKLWVTTHFWA